MAKGKVKKDTKELDWASIAKIAMAVAIIVKAILEKL